MICTLHQILFKGSNQGELDTQGMWHIWKRTEMHAGFRWGNLDHLADLGTDERMILK
jgi:hypothetical protein